MQGNPQRYKRYAQVQAKFFAWCHEQAVEPMEPSGIAVVNFLAEGHSRLQWSVSTIANHRSAILDLFPNRTEIIGSYAHRTFMQALQEQSIRADRSRPIDITPVIDHLRNLGSNDTMSLPDLTAKLSWLLGVSGFLRPSDIERIDLDESDWTSYTDRILLQVVAPKEKRLSARIRKTVTIQRHPEVYCCPVEAFLSYHRRHAYRPCVWPHPVLPSTNIHYLLRDVRDCHKPIHWQRIGKYINCMMDLLPKEPWQGRLRARALGATRALLNGASVDEVVSHGNWSSRAIFDNFYRLSTDTSTNFTSLALATPRASVNTLEPQSLDPLNEV
jgi:hypothetical protein